MDGKRKATRQNTLESFDWLWGKTPGFSQWLRDRDSQNDLFFISGKPGSGKSTLMDYIIDSNRTLECLGQNERKWIIIQFFFDYRARDGLANNETGMLRAFLYQLACKDRAVLERLGTLQSASELDLTDMNALLDVINEAKQATSYNIAFFIDGLDEYENSKTELIHAIQRLENVLKGRIKICLAGRSEPDLGRILRDNPTFRMQDYNKSTMEAIIKHRIALEVEKNINFTSKFHLRVRRKLVETAQGAILWLRFALPKVIEAYNNDSTLEEIHEIIDRIPDEMEGVYDRIFTSLPAANRIEASFFLFLVQEFEDTEYSLDLVWGAYDICGESFQKFVPSLQPGKISNKHELETRLRRLLPNLLDVSSTLTLDDESVPDNDLPLVAKYAKSLGINELPSTVRYAHETLRSYLVKSDFISENLPVAFKQQYSLRFRLQLYAQVLEEASKDEIIPPASLREGAKEIVSIMSASQPFSFKSTASAVAYIVKWCLGLGFLKGIHTATFCRWLFPDALAIILTGINQYGILGRILGGSISLISRKLTNSFPIPPKWKLHFVIFRTALFELLPLASTFEKNESCSSYPVIHRALSCYLSRPIVDMVSACESILYPRLRHQQIVQSSPRYHADLLLAGLFDLKFYLRDSLAHHTAEEIDWLISSAIVMYDETRLAEILPILTSNKAKIELHHICLVLQDTTGFFGSRLGKFLTIIRCLPDTASQQTQKLHHKCCQSDDVKDSLIFDWARISSAWGRDEITDGGLEVILEFLVSTGTDINAPSHNGETPLHAVFNNDINPLHETLELGFRKLVTTVEPEFEVLRKLVALAKLGADPERTGPRGSVLDYAKRYRRRLQQTSLVRVVFDGNYGHPIREIDRAIEYLEHHERMKCWPEMSSTLDD